MQDREPDGATPIDPNEAGGLLPGHISTREQLNEWEQANILDAARWALRTKRRALDELTVRELHRRMFDQTWDWAGRYRTSDKNVGVHWPRIPAEVRKLIDDGQVWLRDEVYPIDEVALRLHHRMVKAHPFPNGNGRHARLWSDLLLRQNRRPPIDWHTAELNHDGHLRRRYLDALRAADERDLSLLLQLYLDGRS